jgi:cell division protein FtsB
MFYAEKSSSSELKLVEMLNQKQRDSGFNFFPSVATEVRKRVSFHSFPSFVATLMEIIFTINMTIPHGGKHSTEPRAQVKMPGDSQEKKAAEALKRENEKLEAENRRKDKEMADLIKKIRNT